jgi:HlyD family secretion protein
VQVTVRLLPDPSTTSGYRWSSGKGPAAAIGTGTMADGYVVTDEIRLLALVIPQVEYVLSRIGL